MRDNFRNDLADNHAQGLSDLTTGGTAPATGFFAGGVVMTAVAFVASAIPITAGFLFLKDRWGKKGRKRSKK
jgi:hypothetical protein